MGMRWRSIEHKTVPELQAEERALRAARETKGAPEVVFSPNGLRGTVSVTVATEDAPSPWARDLAEALDTVETEAACAKMIDRIEEALELRCISTKESGRLLAALGRIAAPRGWLGAEGVRYLEDLLRARLGPEDRG
jgi:hypothetical protein